MIRDEYDFLNQPAYGSYVKKDTIKSNRSYT